MDLHKIQAKQPDFFKKYKSNNTRAFMPFNHVLGLHMLLANPKQCTASFETGLIMLHITAGTTQWTTSPQPLWCEAEANKIHKEIFISFLELGEDVVVIWMLPGKEVPHLTSSPTSL